MQSVWRVFSPVMTNCWIKRFYVSWKTARIWHRCDKILFGRVCRPHLSGGGSISSALAIINRCVTTLSLSYPRVRRKNTLHTLWLFFLWSSKKYSLMKLRSYPSDIFFLCFLRFNLIWLLIHNFWQLQSIFQNFLLMLALVFWVIFSQHFFLYLHDASNGWDSWSLTCFSIIVRYRFFVVQNNGLILWREATEAHPLTLMFSVSLVDVDAEVYDSWVSDVKTLRFHLIVKLNDRQEMG